MVPLAVARYGAPRMRPPGTLLFIGGTSGRQAGVGLTVISAMTAALPALIASLAVELAPIRANVIAAGFVDTPLSASLLGDQLDARRAELRATLPIGRVVGPADIAALAVHLMTNTALTGATLRHRRRPATPVQPRRNPMTAPTTQTTHELRIDPSKPLGDGPGPATAS